MYFRLVSSSSEMPCPSSNFLQPKNNKSFLSNPFLRLGDFTKHDHARALNHDTGRVGVYQPLMSGHLQESSIGQKFQDDKSSLKFKCVRTLLIDNYDSYTYNIYQELSVINGVPPVVVQNNGLTWETIRKCLYDDKAFDNIVISPGPGSPTCGSDIGICRKILQECKDIPIFGVCLGHQALGYVHGAQIVHAPEPVHGRLSEIEHTGCNLFRDIPSGRNSGFKVMRYHSLMIDADSLPKEVIPIAWTYSGDILSYRGTQESARVSCQSSEDTERKETTKIIMGIKHSKWPHYGVQFHPESIATVHGRQIFENFRKITVNYWLRSSQLHERKLYSSVLMQMPFKSQQFREIPDHLLSICSMNKGNLLKVSEPVMPPQVSDARFLKLRWKKFDSLASQVGGAKEIFLELYGKQKAENIFWLDSSSTEQKRARFSFMGGKGGSLWMQITFCLSNRRFHTVQHGGYLSVEDAQGSVKNTFLEDGFLDYLNKELISFRYDEEDYQELPFDFCGGYVGFLGYELKVECGMESNRHKSRAPDACFFFADNIVVIDHHYDDVYILSLHDIHHPESTAHESSIHNRWLDDTEHKLLNLKASSITKFKDQSFGLDVSASSREGFHADKSRDQYMKDVEKCLEFIRDGESYELCLTTQLRKKMENVDSLGLYLELREKNPAPYAAWLNFSKENLSICCSSPERFLQLNRTGMLEAKPIKGTIARGSTPGKDEQLKLQLQHSEKDQAENLMIVDLLRNDLGRVCETGSVVVHPLMEVESYTTVHTLVSTIHGKKRSNLSSVDCIKAAFPGGSMTGAPKLRSMKILDDLETCSRGIYSGSIGFFSYNQTFDLNIVIRTIVIHEDEASIGAGGAIVSMSNPQDEYDEMVLKTRAPVKIVAEYQSRSSKSN